MNVYNKDKTEILTEYNLENGYLVDDIIMHYIPAQEAIQEESHLELIAEYPNGGKSYQRVIDKEGKPAVPAKTEAEIIKVYIPYSETQIRINTINDNIATLKKELTETDYKVLKFLEGLYPQEEFEKIKEQRAFWRKQINELEQELAKLTKD